MCVLFEIALRFVGYSGEIRWTMQDVIPIENKILNYRLKPKSVSFSGDVVYQLNEEGFRGGEWTLDKTNRFRILVLGDSVAYGYKVKFEKIFSQRLLENLRDLNVFPVELESLNLALPGLNTLQESQLLWDEGEKYDPDLVVILYSINDADIGTRFSFEEKTCKINLINMPVPCVFKDTLKKSAFLFFVKQRVDQLLWKVGIGDDDDPMNSLKNDYFNSLYLNRHGWENHVENGFKKISQFAVEKKVKIILVIFPVLYDFKNYKWIWIHEKVSAAAKRHRFIVVDLFSKFKQYSYDVLRIERGDFVHPNDLGNQIAADVVSEKIIALQKSQSLGWAALN